MPDDARRALLNRFFDHAPTFPPASLPFAEALAEDRRARESKHAWMLGRFVLPAARLSELPQDEHRAIAVVESGGDDRIEAQGEAIYIENRAPDYVASRGVRAKIRCGGERIPSVEELAEFVRGCRQLGVVFKATAGLHHAYPTLAGSAGGKAADARPADPAAFGGGGAGEHGFLNLLAAVVFGDEEEALREQAPAFALDAASFRWRDREALPGRLADVRASLFHSIGTCSFFEPVDELEQLAIL